MRFFSGALVCGASAFLVGCAASPEITSAYVAGTDFGRYRTFALPERVEMGGGAAADSVLATKVRAAVVQSLSSKGLAAADPSGVDVLVAVHGHLDSQAETARYSRLRSGPWIRGRTIGPGLSFVTATEVVTSRSGVLAVDIVDRRSREIVWLGAARKRYVSEQPDPDRIAAVVGLILQGFPPRSAPAKAK